MELYKAGTTGTAIQLIDQRLAYRSTIYEWNEELLGAAIDDTGFEQGGINSGEFYKLYNNEQLKIAEQSKLGVDIGSSVISAVGAADDVILVSNSIHSLYYLAKLTEDYCRMYRVKLVPSKTKLLPVYKNKMRPLVDYARITNPIKIAGESVEFVDVAEHVGILRGSTGNTINVIHRIAAHKKSLAAVCSAGLARGQRSNPAAALRVHQLYSLPVLFSGIASTILNKKDLDILEKHYKETIQNIQKLHTATPRSVVYLLAGSLPALPVLHCKQLSFFSMICRMQQNPLNKHARYILTEVKTSACSWFYVIYELCLKYRLPNPLVLLNDPPHKKAFKRQVKLRVIDYWQDV